MMVVATKEDLPVDQRQVTLNEAEGWCNEHKVPACQLMLW